MDKQVDEYEENILSCVSCTKYCPLEGTLLTKEKWMSKVVERRGLYTYIPSSETSLTVINT